MRVIGFGRDGTTTGKEGSTFHSADILVDSVPLTSIVNIPFMSMAKVAPPQSMDPPTQLYRSRRQLP